ARLAIAARILNFGDFGWRRLGKGTPSSEGELSGKTGKQRRGCRLHARESCDSRVGEAFEGLAVEMLSRPSVGRMLKSTGESRGRGGGLRLGVFGWGRLRRVR